MNSSFSIVLIDEADNRFPTFGHVESWTRSVSIIANEVRRSQVGIDFFLELLDFDLVKVNPGVRFWI